MTPHPALRTLRARAEDALRMQPPRASRPCDVGALVHELEIHQLELELQNEALHDLQQEVESSRARYRRLFELCPAAILVLTDTGRILEANAAACRLLGAESDELSGTPFAECVMENDAEALELHRREVQSERKPAQATVSLGVKGEPVEIRLDSVCTDTETGEWLTSLSPVAEGSGFAMAADAPWRGEATSTLAAGIAHDFNNLLHAVLAGAHLALHRLDRDSPARSAIELIRRAAWRGRSVVRQLQDQMHPEREPSAVTDLNQLISTAAPLAQRLLGEDVELVLDLAAPDAVARIDAGHVEEVLLNLASNARRAMPMGGKLTISTANVRTAEGCRHIRLRVQDTGVGMDAETRKRAFEPLFSTHGANGGKGLGLVMVRTIAERAGGSVALDSEVGRGTGVEIELPLAGQRAVPSELPPAADLPMLHVDALVVEDDPLSQLAAATYLEQMASTVTCAPSAEEALEFLEANPGRVSVLVADVVLPGMSGMELAASARALDPRLMVILVSAHERRTLLERKLVPESTPVLRKPFTPHGLVDAIREAQRCRKTTRPPSVR